MSTWPTLVWPFQEEEVVSFGAEVVGCLSERGLCLVDLSDAIVSSEQLQDLRLSCKHWFIPPAELEEAYVGEGGYLKVSQLPTTSAAPELEALHVLEEKDFNDRGRALGHLNFLDRRHVLVLAALDGEGDAVVVRHQQAHSNTDKQESQRVPIAPGQLLFLAARYYTFQYVPGAVPERSTLFLSWLMTQPCGPNVDDPQVALLPLALADRRCQVTGTACRSPGNAWSWQEAAVMYSACTDCASRTPLERYDVDAYLNPHGFSTNAAPIYTAHCSWCSSEAVLWFDNNFWHLPRAEAAGMNPEQRLLLEVGIEVLLHSGHTQESLRGCSCGVYVGEAGWNSGWEQAHGIEMFQHSRAEASSADLIKAYHGLHHAVHASRLSHALGLRGPANIFDTACSSSLVALGQACQALRCFDVEQDKPSCQGLADEAVVLGVLVISGPAAMAAYCMNNMTSVSGRSTTFDQSASGFGRGEGIGAVVLAPVEDSASERSLEAAMCGTCSNQDGRSAGLTAPNGSSQQQCILNSLREAEIGAVDWRVAELHGTGTALGDPIEVSALRRLCKSELCRPLHISSAKSACGHCEAAAGIVGVVKAMGMLRFSLASPTVHLRTLNPNIGTAPSFLLCSFEGVETDTNSGYAGVSSFGLGGTNSHADMWASCSVGPHAARDLFDMGKHRDRLACYERLQLLKTLGPRVGDTLAIADSWDGYTSFHTMKNHGSGWYEGHVALDKTQKVRFVVIVNEDWDQVFHPGPDGAVAGPSSLGKKLRTWLIDGAALAHHHGRVYRICFRWTFSWTSGLHRSICWEPT